MAKCWNQLLRISCYIWAEKVLHMRSGHSFSTSYGIFLPRIWHWSQAKTWRVRLSIWSDIAFPTFLKENREKKSVSHCFYKQPSVYHIDTQVRCIYPFILSTHMPIILKRCSILGFFFSIYNAMTWKLQEKKYFGDITKHSLGISGHCFSLYLWQCIW